MNPWMVKSSWILLGASVTVFAQAAEHVSTEAHHATATNEEIRQLIRQLSSASYEQREAADARLRDIGMPTVDHLARAYRESDDFEVRVRIQRIAERIFFWDRVLGRNGFLGISHRVYIPPPGGDPRVQPGTAAFEIRQIIPDTSAERAGLMAGDLIVSVDGTKLPEGAGPGDFADLIRYKRPGVVMTFEFFRGREYHTLPIVIGHRPLRHYGRAAPKELNAQLETAVREFPAWWSSRFVSPPAKFSSDRPTPDHPLFLEIPPSDEK